MATALAVTVVLHWKMLWMELVHRPELFSGSGPVVFAKSALTTTVVTTLAWIVVTFLTKPEPQETLVSFYRRVRPHVSGWQPVAQLAPEIPPTRDLGRNLISWVLGCAMVYLALFGVGRVLLGPSWKGIVLLTLSALCAIALYANLARSGWNREVQPESGIPGAGVDG